MILNASAANFSLSATFRAIWSVRLTWWPDDRPVVQVERRREIIHDGVQQHLHALVLERRTAEDRDDAHLQACAPEHRHDFLRGDLLPFEVLLEQRVVLVGDRFEHFGPVLLAQAPACRAGSRSRPTRRRASTPCTCAPSS